MDPDNPFHIEFIIDTADQKEVSREDASRLIRYFLAGLTLPEKDIWVNLSPYEQERIINDDLGRTDLGEDLLAQDYILKQLASSLTYPESETGKTYWAEIYSRAGEAFHTTKFPFDTFNKIWIMPDKATVYENNNVGIISQASMKVMLEEDYLALKNNLPEIQPKNTQAEAIEQVNKIGSQVTREQLLPLISNEVNSGKNFANLRQIHYALILGVWFKQKFRESVYAHYINQGKIQGIDSNGKDAKEKIYSRYLEAFKKGVYNYIKSEVEPVSSKRIKRQYFSGGYELGASASLSIHQQPLIPTTTAAELGTIGTEVVAEVNLNPIAGANVSSSSIQAAETKPLAAGEIKFGTSGVRGQLKEEGFTWNHVVARTAQGVADYHNATVGKGSILIGYDPRKGNTTFVKDTAALLAANGIPVKVIFDEPTPTPVLGYLANSNTNITGVVNFTASHNPAIDDGFKYSPSHGGAAEKGITDAIQEYANKATQYRTMDYDKAKAAGLIEEVKVEAAVKAYVHEYVIPQLKKIGAWKDILGYIKSNPEFHVVLDAMQGTSVEYLKAIFAEIAAEIGRSDFYEILHVDNRDPDFKQVNGAPNPTLKGSTVDLVANVSGRSHTMGFGVDGDADRFGVVDFGGKTVTADDMIGILGYFLKKEIGVEGAIGKTVATSNFVNAVAEYLKTGLIETAVGFKWMVDRAVNENVRFIVAGEESAHVGIGPFMQSWDDGMAVSLASLWVVAKTGKSISEYKAEIERAIGMQFNKTTDTIRGADDGIKKPLDSLISRTNRELEKKISKLETTVVKEVEQLVGVKVKDLITVDGVKIVFENNDWLLMRPSGTEPAIKIYTEISNKFGESPVFSRIVTMQRAANKALEKELFRIFSDEKVETRMETLYEVDSATAEKHDEKLVKIAYDLDDKKEPNRLGWTRANLEWIFEHPETVEQVIKDGETIRNRYKYVIFSGMGGSGLSVQVVKSTFGEKTTKIYSLRTTDRAVIEDILNEIVNEEGSLEKALAKTLVIPVSKSGTTQETVSHKQYFEDLYAAAGIDLKEHMWVITDKGSPMDTGEFEQREIQLNGRGDIGGRFTAPTTNVFLLPLAIVAPEKVWPVLKQAQEMNSGIQGEEFMRLASFLYYNALIGKDKLTMFMPQNLKDVPMWSEQLFEESLGKGAEPAKDDKPAKDGKGITVFYGENLSAKDIRPVKNNDRVFFRVNLNGQKTNQELWDYLDAQGYPVFELNVKSIEDIGGIMLGFQRAVAAVAYLWDINFVNQPAVEGYKKETRAVVKEMESGGKIKMPDESLSARFGNLAFYYAPLINANRVSKEALAAAVAKLGTDMNNAPAVFAAALSILKAPSEKLQSMELMSYGRMTDGMKAAFEYARAALFTKGLRIPSKLGEGPDKNHSFHQNVEGGKDMWLSLYFMAQKLNPSEYPATYDDNLLKAQTVGTVRSLENAGRRVLLLVSEGTREEAEKDLAAFFRQAESYLVEAGALSSSSSLDAPDTALDDDEQDGVLVGNNRTPYGGIDMDKLNVETEGGSSSSSLLNLPKMDMNDFKGLTFTIIKLEQVSDLKVILGNPSRREAVEKRKGDLAFLR